MTTEYLLRSMAASSSEYVDATSLAPPHKPDVGGAGLTAAHRYPIRSRSVAVRRPSTQTSVPWPTTHLVSLYDHNGTYLALSPPSPDDLQEMGMLKSLREDVSALSGDLRTVKGKLETIMSLLSDVMASVQNHPAPISINRRAAGGGGGDRSGFEGGNVIGSAAAPAAVANGGRVGCEGWIGGGGEQTDGGIRRGARDWSVHGAPAGHFGGRYLPMGHQQQGAVSRPLHPPPPQTPSSTQPYPIGPQRVRGRYDEGLNILAACARS